MLVTVYQQLKDHAAMLQLQTLLSGEEWSAATLEYVAEIIQAAGYMIAPYEPKDE
jgi:hypothetical protein